MIDFFLSRTAANIGRLVGLLPVSFVLKGSKLTRFPKQAALCAAPDETGAGE